MRAMPDAPERPLTWVTERSALEAMAARLGVETQIALDTEANGFHRYHERVCLVQLSTAAEDWLVDPLALPDLAPLAPVLADPGVRKLLHGADYDVIGLRRDFGFEIRGLFDTMIAARLAGRTEVSLRALLRDFCDVHVDKASQRADWTVRPLPPHLVSYARGDTRYLPVIAARLEAELAAAGRTAAAREEFAVVETRVARGERFPLDGWTTEPVAKRMTPRERGVLKALWEWRDGEARRRDQPPFRVLATETIVALAQARPTRVEELARQRGLADRLAHGAGARALVAVIESAPPAELPRRAHEEGRTPFAGPAERARFEALRKWRAAAALRRKMDPGLLIANGALREIARAQPATRAALEALPEVRRWQVEELGAEILDVLAGDRKPST